MQKHIKTNTHLKKVYKEVGHYEQTKSKKVNAKKEWVQINWIFWWFLVIKGIGPFAESFCVDKYENVEGEGELDEADAAEDPNGEGSQSRRGGGGRWDGRVEHVHQHLFLWSFSGFLHYIKLRTSHEERGE